MTLVIQLSIRTQASESSTSVRNLNSSVSILERDFSAPNIGQKNPSESINHEGNVGVDIEVQDHVAPNEVEVLQ